MKMCDAWGSAVCLGSACLFDAVSRLIFAGLGYRRTVCSAGASPLSKIECRPESYWWTGLLIASGRVAPHAASPTGADPHGQLKVGSFCPMVDLGSGQRAASAVSSIAARAG